MQNWWIACATCTLDPFAMQHNIVSADEFLDSSSSFSVFFLSWMESRRSKSKITSAHKTVKHDQTDEGGLK